MRPEEPSRSYERTIWSIGVGGVAFFLLFTDAYNSIQASPTSLFVLIGFCVTMFALGRMARQRRIDMEKKLAEYDALMARLATTSDER